jgi:hypothetical protein
MSIAILLNVNRRSNSWKFKWENSDGYFRKLVTENPYYDQYKTDFWRYLHDVADSNCIKVCEGITTYCTHKPHFEDRFNDVPYYEMELTSRILIDTDDLRKWDESKKAHFSFDKYKFNYTPKSFKWDEIKDFFIELSIPQIALLDGDFLNKHTELDKRLADACCRFDFESARIAISEGADVNAQTGVCGETIISETISATPWGNLTLKELNKMSQVDLDSLKVKNTKLAKKIINLLVANGADLDLYGYGLGTPLLECYYCNNAEMMSYILEKGANPNVFSNLIDAISFGYEDWYVQSEVLDTILESYDGDEQEEKKMLQLLESHGAKRFIDNYDPH